MYGAREDTFKAVNRGDKRIRRVHDRVFVKFERSCRYRCQEKKARRGRARDPVFRDPATPRTSPRSLFAARDSPPPRFSRICFLFILHFNLLACRSMNMKVHQTLVWLNLLSFRTKDLAAPIIGIQSAANHNTLLRHFDSITPAYPLPHSPSCNCVRV
jgi:hypothetical protein